MDIDITIYCDCGEMLGILKTNYLVGGAELIAEPCEACTEASYEKGKEEGESP